MKLGTAMTKTRWSVVKNTPVSAGDRGFDSWVRKIP